MIKYNYSNSYQNSLNFLDDNSGEPYDPLAESFKKYVELFEDFNPISNPPEPEEKRKYIDKFIIPILQIYAKSFEAILEIDEKEDFVKINIIAKQFVLINLNSDFNLILSYATFYRITSQKEEIKLELYFSTRIEG